MQQTTVGLHQSTEELELEILELEKAFQGSHDAGLYELLKYKKQLLWDLLDSKVRGAVVKAQFQGLSQMDVPIQFFFSLEKKHVEQKMIGHFKKSLGQVLSHPVETRNFAVNFFSHMYAAKHVCSSETQWFLMDFPRISTLDVDKLVRT